MDDISDDLRKAIGRLSVDTAHLEYAVANLVAVIREPDEGVARTWLAKPSCARKKLRQLVAEGTEPKQEIVRLDHDARAILDDRGRLLHSVAFIAEDGSPPVFWNPKSDREAVITSAQVEELAAEARNTTGRLIRLANRLWEAKQIKDGGNSEAT